MRGLRPLLYLVLFFVSCNFVIAQNDSVTVKKDSVDFYEMSLDQLLKLKAHGVPSELEKLINSLIAVASKKPLNVRESPSIVTLITEDEIKKSGARDIMDVLRLVPGVDFGVDVEGTVGISMRGNWAHEGKVLLLLDGQEMNEILFASSQFGNHFPIEQIKKIEVIRGPGSAIYGGFAEFGVINIITRQADDINGLTVSGTYGQMAGTYGRRNANLSIGKKFGDFSFSLSGMLGQGQRSNQVYRDYHDTTYNMAGNSNLDDKYFNMAMAYKGLSFRLIGDFFNTKVGDGYGDVIKSGAVTESFNSVYSELKYVIKFNDKFTLTPRINYKTQTPWLSPSYDTKTPYNRTATRTLGNLTASYNINRHINFVFGGEYYQDKAVDYVDSSYFKNGTQNVSYYNYSFFAQGLIKTRFVNFIVGARFDKHNAYGQAFVPRVGLTKKYKKFHFKALYSNSFRAPAIENINDADSNGIRPELTQVLELELGYQVTRKSIFTINAYDITTNNPIVYYTDSLANDLYTNSGKSGTQGIEAEYRIRDKWGYITMNYAFYTVANKNKIADYEVRDDKAALLGFANHRLNLTACVNVAKGLSINATASYYGARWAYTSIDSLGNSVLEKTPSNFLLNFFVKYDTPLKGLSIGVGCYDILDQKFKYIQPYNGGHAPLPGPAREFVFRLQYNLNFNKAGN